MIKKLYVGNLQPKATQDDVKDLFSPYGEVHSVKIIMDWETGSSRGFGFVEMDNENANDAMSALDGKDFLGLNLRVSEARERKTGRRGTGGGGRSRYGSGSGGGRRFSW